jgi:acetylornithine deacetylase/succinyl-diaminopimelate desuccinylase-like protein
MISDSSMFAPGKPALMLGLRGLCYIEVTVRGASHDLHSGLYGGAAPNPIHALSSMIASLHDEAGRVTVPGFYDDVVALTEQEREAIRELPFHEAGWLEELDVPAAIGDEDYSLLERVTVRPTLDCNGIWGGYTGEGAKTVIASEAHAKISCRLVPAQDPNEIAEKLVDYLNELTPDAYEMSAQVFHGGKAYRASPDLPAVKAASSALKHVWDEEPLFTWGGGSIPVVADFKEVLGLDTVLMGLGLEDDRLHSPNEKFDVVNFHQGIRAAAHFLMELAEE